MPNLVWKYDSCIFANYKFVTKEDAEVELQLKKYECRNEKANVWLTDERPTKKDERYDEWYIDNVRCFKPEFPELEDEYEEMLDEITDNDWSTFNDFDYRVDDGDYYDLIKTNFLD